MTTLQLTEMQRIDALEKDTISAINQEDTECIKQLFSEAENMFINGTEFTKSLISNLYILPVTQILEMYFLWGKQYLGLLPKNLKEEYKRQINLTCI